MAKRCDLTGVGAQSGNNVSHSHRCTRRKFQPNIQHITLKSDILNRSFRMQATAATIRTVDHKGGLDNFLLNTSNTKLTLKAKKIKKAIIKSLGGPSETPKAKAAKANPVTSRAPSARIQKLRAQKEALQKNAKTKAVKEEKKTEAA